MKNAKNENKNNSETMHDLDEKSIMSEKELKELLEWFDGKILRSEEY